MIPAVQVYLDVLSARRADILHTLDGLDATALNWHPLDAETNSLYALATHALGAERKWIHEIIGGRTIERDRDAELHAQGTDTQSLRALYASAASESEEILARLTLADLDAPRAAMRYGQQSVQWCVLRVIEHYNEHLGQLALTRQLWENRK